MLIKKTLVSLAVIATVAAAAVAARASVANPLSTDVSGLSLPVSAVDTRPTVHLPEAPTYVMGAGAFGLLLCFAWKVHSQGRGVIRIDHSHLNSDN
jgi:hypothetical protein